LHSLEHYWYGWLRCTLEAENQLLRLIFLLPSAVVGRLCQLDGVTNAGYGLPLGDKLLNGFVLASDFLGCLADIHHGEAVALSRRIRTLIYSGPTSGGHVMIQDP
jgi:hypothetical protein